MGKQGMHVFSIGTSEWSVRFARHSKQPSVSVVFGVHETRKQKHVRGTFVGLRLSGAMGSEMKIVDWPLLLYAAPE